MDEPSSQDILDRIKKYTVFPTSFVGHQAENADRLRSLTRDIFRRCVDSLDAQSRRQLPIDELIIDDFNDEQIWQEIELYNELALPLLTADISRLTAVQHRLTLGVASAAEPANLRAPSPNASANQRQQLAENVDGADGGGDNGDGGGVLINEVRAVDDEYDDEGYSDAETSSGIGSDSEQLADGEDGDGGGRGVCDRAEVCAAGDAAQPSAAAAAIGVTDDFFSLEEMNRFLDEQDRKFERQQCKQVSGRGRSSDPDDDDDDDDDEDDVDLFAEHCGHPEEETQDGRTQYRYSDFFDPPHSDAKATIRSSKRKRQETHQSSDSDASNNDNNNNSNNDDDDDDDEEHVTGDKEHDAGRAKSNLERRHERLREHIAQMEQERLESATGGAAAAAGGGAAWQLSGETRAAARPRDALLHEPLDFEQTRRAPLITADVTAALERIICRRVADAAWDDVQRQVKPTTDPYQFKRRLVLDQQKSQFSLAQIYEQEYQKQQAAAEAARPEHDMAAVAAGDGDDDDQQQQQQDPATAAAHADIKRQMSELFAKLDALTNFHFVPKKPSAEVKIVTKLPALSAEETIPTAMSNMELLAPEEIKEKKRAAPLAKDERDDTDKKRERRKKKRLQSARAARRAERSAAASRTLATARAEAAEAGVGGGVGGAAAAVGGRGGGVGGALSRRLAQQQVDAAAKHGRVTKVSKKPNANSSAAFKSSTAFFTQLQEQVTSELHQTAKAKKAKTGAQSSDYAKMRL